MATAFRSITDERMFKVADHLIKNKVKGIASVADFMVSVGSRQSNAHNIKTGRQSFTHEQVLSCCKQYGISADYIYGLTTEMFRKPPSSPLDRLKSAIAELELSGKLK